MVGWNKVNVKLSDSQLNKPGFAVKNQSGVTLRNLSMNMSDRNELLHACSRIIINSKTTNKIKKCIWRQYVS